MCNRYVILFAFLKKQMMGNHFNKTIQEIGNFSPEQVQQIVDASLLRATPKNEIVLKVGEVCNSCYFIDKGAAYQYELNEDSEERIIDLYAAGDWVINVTSFTKREPSKHIIKTYADSLLYELKIDVIHKLIEKHPSFIQMGKVLGADSFRTDIFDQKLTPDLKYDLLIQKKADLLQTFPQHMIASFLKITPETLSRVRGRYIS